MLLTLVLIVVFRADHRTKRWFAVIRQANPILIPVSCNSSHFYLLMRWLKVPHNVVSSGAHWASKFFERAVAAVITLFGPGSPAALASVVGVLVEVPVMLSVGKDCNATRGWYQWSVGETAAL